MKQEAFLVSYYNDDLISGTCLKIDRDISTVESMLGQEVSALIQNNTREEIEELQRKHKEEELAIFKKVKLQVEEWVEVAKQIRKSELALRFLDIPEPEHTNNEWQVRENGRETVYFISNKTYRMRFNIYERTKYKEGKCIPVAWEVTWSLCTNTPHTRIIEITGQLRKKFLEKEKCIKYVSGRKKAYEKFFKEIQPAIVAGYEHVFMVSGVLLPGYQVQDH